MAQEAQTTYLSACATSSPPISLQSSRSLCHFSLVLSPTATSSSSSTATATFSSLLTHSAALSFRLLPSTLVTLIMDDRPSSLVEGNAGNSDGAHSNTLDIYPLNCYFFGSKDAVTFKDETLADRVRRMKLNYDTYGLRTCVQAVLLVELFKHPHLLLLQVRNSIYKLPGGRVRPGESDIECLKRKLTSQLSMDEHDSWEVVECIGMWWRSDFETLVYPYLPPNIKRPKECTKLFLVRLPASCKFIVPKNFNLLAIPLRQVHENHKTYGPIISGVPQLLSKFSINVVEP